MSSCQPPETFLTWFDSQGFDVGVRRPKPAVGVSGRRGSGNLAGQPERCYPAPNGVILSGGRVPVKGLTERRSELGSGTNRWGPPATGEVRTSIAAAYDSRLAELSRFGHNLLDHC